MRSFSSLWPALDQHLLGQHRDPVAFFQRMERTGFWHVFWPTRLIVALCGLVIAPGVLYAWSGEPFIIIATAVAVAALVFVSGLFMIVASPIAGDRPGFWIAYLFLYHFSLPILSVILLCALAALTPLALWLGWLIGAPWLLGVSFADACTLAVYQNAIKGRDQRKKLRTGGPAADLPELALGQIAFWVRSALAAALALGALAVFWFYGANGMAGSVALLAGAAGCARVESTLLAAFGWPLVQFEPGLMDWRAAYPGRTALSVDRAAACRALLAAADSKQPSGPLRALLRAGSLSFALRGACVQLPPVQLHALLLDLSLHEGGAATIRFLQARLPAGAWQRRAQQYAALAAEAAKPPDLQRWIACLPAQPTSAALALTDDIEAALVDARGMLLLVQAEPIVTPNRAALQQLAQALTEQIATDGTGHLPWPVALQNDLDAHQRLLHATAHAYR